MRDVNMSGFEVESTPLTVQAMDGPIGNASHEYRVLREDGAQVGHFIFHRTLDIVTEGVNGITPESLLAIISDHIKDNDCYAERERAMACRRLDEAARALKTAAQKREKPVEGIVGAEEAAV